MWRSNWYLKFCFDRHNDLLKSSSKTVGSNISEVGSATERDNLILTHAVWRTVFFPPSGRHTPITFSAVVAGKGEKKRLCFIESRNETTGQ
jgi:hypothetical protein